MTRWLDELRADARHAGRQLLATPTFALVVASTLAIGIGATTTIFSVVNAVLLQPLPFADPERVVIIGEDYEGQTSSVSGGNYNDWRSRSRSFTELAAFHDSSFNLASGDAPERVLGARTTHNFFAVFGIPTALGRTYTADEDRPGGDDVVVLSDRLWRRQFAAAPDVIGMRIRMDGRDYTVIGVMSPAFDRMASPEELWVPVAFTAERLAEHDEHFLEVIGRLAPGLSLEQATTELAAIYRQVRTELPAESQVRRGVPETLLSQLVGNVRERLLVLLGAVLFVLLLACANVAHLLLARGGTRAHEIAVRGALGAQRSRIVRQLLTEAVALALVGGILGIVTAYAAIPLLVTMSPDGVPRLDEAGVDARVLTFALLASFVSAVIAGLAPAVVTTRADLRSAISEGGRNASFSRERLRFVLITAEVAVALVLLAGAGLLVRSALRLQQVDPGFEASGVLSARLTLPATGYEHAEKVVATFDEIVRTLSTQTGVAAAAVTSSAPMANEGNNNGLLPEGNTYDPNDVVQSQLAIVGGDYLRVMRIPLVAGRSFTDTDQRDTPLVMLLSETAARRLFPGRNAVGTRVACCEPGPDGIPRLKLVVGIVGDVRTEGLESDPQPQFYLPIAQAPPVAWTWTQRSMTIVARGRTVDPAALTGALRAAVHEVDPAVPLYSVATIEQRLAATLAPRRFNTALMLVLGAVGLLLASIGIYGVISYVVTQRQREIAIRVALGAPGRSVVRMVIARGMRPVLLGISLGVAGALAASQVLSTYVFEITTRDPLTMAAAIAVLLAAALAATAVPARRAAKIDPARTLNST